MYSCGHFVYQVTDKINMKEHIHCNHNDEVYSFDQCFYHANYVAFRNLKRERNVYDKKSAEMK